MRKTTVFLMSLALLVAFSSSTVWAAGDKDEVKKEKGGWYESLTPEQQKTFETSMAEQRAKMEPLRDQMWAKELEFEALTNNPNTKPDDIKALVGEMSSLRKQIRAEQNNFRDKMKKDGFSKPYGHKKGGPDGDYDGYNRGGCGGRNYGQHNRGQGYHHNK